MMTGLALALVVACDRREEPASQTQTTSGDMNSEERFVPPPLPMNTGDTSATKDESTAMQEDTTAAKDEPAAKDERAAKTTAENKPAKKKAITAKKTVTKASPEPEKAALHEAIEDAVEETPEADSTTAGPPIVGTATITSVYITPMDATGGEGQPAAETPPANEGQPSSGYVNRSTPLGNGDSGMYTGGQGTYGGRATWGTGTTR
jgi:hypothetical protein